jgi:hypothetical protein
MSKKGLLNEATVRRFMGLAGMEAKIVSNALKEMYSKRDDEEDKMEEGMYAEEEPAADAEMPPVEEPSTDGEMDMGAAEEPMADEAEVELSPEDISKLKALKDAAMEAAEVVDMLDSAAGEEAGEPAGEEAPELDDAGDADMDAPEEDEEVMEALSGINLELNEDELVQEVAKRVAKRLIRAKKAQAQLDEALGRKSRTKQ